MSQITHTNSNPTPLCVYFCFEPLMRKTCIAQEHCVLGVSLGQGPVCIHTDLNIYRVPDRCLLFTSHCNGFASVTIS